MSHHDTLNLIYWLAGIAGVALLGLWIALSVASQREHRQRIARYDAVRREHWESVKDMLPDCARDLPPEHDPYITKPRSEGEAR